MTVERIVLVRKDRFDSSNFKEVVPEAETVIANAKNDELLALTIQMNSPLKVVDAKIYTMDVFDNILKV